MARNASRQLVAPYPHPSGERAPRIPKEFVPRHVAIVMDGNGRWANSRGDRKSTRQNSSHPQQSRMPSSA